MHRIHSDVITQLKRGVLWDHATENTTRARHHDQHGHGGDDRLPRLRRGDHGTTAVPGSASSDILGQLRRLNRSHPQRRRFISRKQRSDKSYQLPLLRTDVLNGSQTNSIIHVTNSTSASSTLTLTTINSDGSINGNRFVAVPSTIARLADGRSRPCRDRRQWLQRLRGRGRGHRVARR